MKLDVEDDKFNFEFSTNLLLRLNNAWNDHKGDFLLQQIICDAMRFIHLTRLSIWPHDLQMLVLSLQPAAGKGVTLPVSPISPN